MNTEQMEPVESSLMQKMINRGQKQTEEGARKAAKLRSEKIAEIVKASPNGLDAATEEKLKKMGLM